MTFLREWQNYLASRSDSPPAFAIPSGLTVLAAALGNRVFVHGWGSPIWPNLWTVLIAPSGFGKSLPLNVGADVLERAGLGHLVLPDTFSIESLIYRFAKEPIGIFVAQEFAAFVDTLGASYNAGSEKWLTSLYDGGEKAGKRSIRDANAEGGYREMYVKRPAVSMLGASSPDWFAKAFTDAALRGGFFARMLFVPSNAPGKFVSFPGPPDHAVLSGLAGHLRQVGQLYGEFDISKVKEPFTTWDREQRRLLREETDTDFSGVQSRAGALCLKTMMAFHVSRDPYTQVFDLEDFELAHVFVEKAMNRAMRYLQSQVPRNKPEATRLKIMEILSREPRKRHSEMLTELHITSYELKGHIETLSESDKLKIQSDETGMYYVATAPPISISTNGHNGNGHV